MSIDPIGGIDKTVSGYDKAYKAHQNATGEQQSAKIAVKGKDPVSVSLQRMSSIMGKLETVNEEKNIFAKNIRETDKALQEVSGVIDKMKVHLDKIVKNWPPFPLDSEQRKEILMSYVSLRKEILQMMVPSPPAAVYEKNTKLWEKLGYTDTKNLHDSMPEITGSSTDEQVRTASARLDGLQSTVLAGRSELVRMVSE